MTYVIDASVAMKWFVRESLHEEALPLTDQAERLEAPDLIVAEVANIAWKKTVRGEIAYPHARFIVGALPRFFAALHPSGDLAAQALEMTLDLGHPVYDCLYVNCASVTEGVLITADTRLCAAVENTPYAHLVRHLGDL